jgi:hypothetical protein
MENLLVGQSSGKSELSFNGVFKGFKINKVLLSNRCVEEGKSYAVAFKEFDIIEGSLIVDVTKMKELEA